jgi:hypothetical protein
MLEYRNGARHILAEPVAICGLFLAFGVSAARAQSIDSYHLQPYADDTNIIETDFAYQHFNAFQFSNGQTVPDTHFDQFSVIARYWHYFSIDGHTASI